MDLSIGFKKVKPGSEGDRGDLFETVERKRSLAELLVEQMERAILEGKLKPGDRLPTERDLGEQFGVSRTVVREALHTLVTKNHLAVVPGLGAVVREPNTETMSESIRFLLSIGRPQIELQELVAARLHLEPEIAALCALNRSESYLGELREIVSGMEAAPRVEEFVEHDLMFHYALAQGSGNRLYAVLITSILEVVADFSLASSVEPSRRKRATDYHRLILGAVEAGEPDAARSAMRRHLEAFDAGARSDVRTSRPQASPSDGGTE